MDSLHWDDKPEGLRAPIVVAAFRGWNDAAAAATTALSTIGEMVNAERVATIDPDEFYDFQTTRPLIDTSEGGRGTLSWPEVEIFAARVPDAEHDLILISGAEPSMRWRSFSRLLLDTAAQLGGQRVVLLGALLADVAHTNPVRLTGISPDEAVVEELGLRPPSYSGPTGILGVLQHGAADHNMQALSLWAPVSHYAAGITNTKASLALVETFSTVTGIPVATTTLSAAAEIFEEQVSRAVEADPRLRNLVERLQRAAEEADRDEVLNFNEAELPTGDELAAELERFLREQGDGGTTAT